MVHSSKVPLRLALARSVIQRWPIARGRGFISRLLLYRFDNWPDAADFEFEHGRFVGASIRPWPRGYRDLFLYGVMEESEVAVWRALLRPGDVVVDGGANWGFFSLLAARLVSDGGKILSFEPMPLTAAALRRNVAASGVQNIEVIEMALSDKRETIKINLFNDDPANGRATIGSHGNQSGTSFPCETALLDDCLAERSLSPVLVKLDVEGAELFALRGAQATLSKPNAPVVSFEWNVTAASGMGTSPQQTLELLRGHGYRPYLASVGGLVPFAERSVADWTPMVWCIKDGELRDRLVRRGILRD